MRTVCVDWWVSMGLSLKAWGRAGAGAGVGVVGEGHGGVVEVDRTADRVIVFVTVVLVAVAVEMLAARAIVAVWASSGISKEAVAARGVREKGGWLGNNHGYFGLVGLVGVLRPVLGGTDLQSHELVIEAQQIVLLLVVVRDDCWGKEEVVFLIVVLLVVVLLVVVLLVVVLAVIEGEQLCTTLSISGAC
ncbi:hypothetical protein BKA57DRAFT_318487 [Linnemannia elongata]|nr:hypothetical protein BKA57DRAFT_318487 [Linnemannia elongata]